MRIIVDTNCLLASIPPKSDYYWLYELFKAEKFEWVISNEILAEYEEQLAKMYSQQTATLVLNILSIAPNTLFSEPYYNWQLLENDKDDNKFVDLAIAVGADYLVTNDKHFNTLKNIDFPKVNVVSLSEFKAIMNAQM